MVLVCAFSVGQKGQVGTRICNGLGIMRGCLETQKLEQLEARMDEIADRVARNRQARRGRRKRPDPRDPAAAGRELH